MSNAGNEGPPTSDADLESLLRHPHLQQRRRAQIFDRVMASVNATEDPLPRPRRRGWRSVAGSVAAAAVMVVALALGLGRRPSAGDWRSRGQFQTESAASLSLELGCSEGSLERCVSGSVLIVRVQGRLAKGFLTAYADPLETGGQRIWYFSGIPLPALTEDTTPTALQQGIRIGPEHKAGAYEVHLVATRQPVSEVELLTIPLSEVIVEQKQRLVVVQ